MTKEQHIPRALRPGRSRLTQALALYLTKNPDMRVGQALEAAVSIIGQARGENLCVFYIEDDVLADGFDRLNGTPAVPVPRRNAIPGVRPAAGNACRCGFDTGACPIHETNA